MTTTTTLRPGLLVSLKTSVRGNVSYQKVELEAAHQTEAGQQKAKWETTRMVVDAEEHERAKKARSKAAGYLRAVCIQTPFGLLCPQGDAEKLEDAVKAAREEVDKFNATSTISSIDIFVMKGRISPDDVEALKAINNEVRELMDEMEKGIKDLDVKAIREAASRAKDLGGMLSADYEAKVQIAITAARAAATKAVADGPDAKVDASAVTKIAEMRKSFLDMDDSQEVGAPAAKGRTVDLASAAE